MKKTEKIKSKASAKPVFFDPTSHRLVFFSVSAIVFLILAAVWFTFFAAHIYETSLPPLAADGTTSIVENSQGNLSSPQTQIQKDPLAKVQSSPGVHSWADADNDNETVGKEVVAQAAPRFSKVHAFVPYWSKAGLVEARTNIAAIDVLLPEWFSVDGRSGELTSLPNDQRNKLLGIWGQHRDRISLLPVINAGVNQGENRLSWLTSPDQQEELIKAASALAEEKEFDGFCFDFAGASATEVEGIRTFALILKAEFDLKGKESCIIAAIEDELLKHPTIADLTDRLIVLAFQEPGPFSVPTPLADQIWFEQALSALLERVPAEQLVIALGSFGMDWVSGNPNPDYLNYFEITEAAAQHDSSIEMDAESLNSHVSFSDDEGHRHQIWFLDALSAFNQLARSPLDELLGIAIWPVSGGDPGVWDLISRMDPSSNDASVALQNIRSAPHVHYVGKGPLLSVRNPAIPGRRDLVLDDESGLIIDANYLELPRAFTVHLKGTMPKNTVILTFDDGPSRAYTPKILDILKEYDVPAVFFVVGSRVQSSPELVGRMVEEGHELGVHTYYHPNISEISGLRLRLELHASQELIKSVSGLNTNLFRAPYGFDENPETLEEAGVLNLIADEQYVVVGIEIDSSDWMRPGVENIVDTVTTLVDANQGNVVLLHDAGGNREQTIQALPKIIEALQEMDVSIVPLSSISEQGEIFHSREVIQEQDLLRDLSFWLIRALKTAITAAFFVLITIGIIRSVGVLVLALIKERRTHESGAPQLPVTVLIPAYCEETVITKAITSVLQSTYPIEEVIVIDDGSTDDTARVVSANFSSDPRVRLVRQNNQGKAEALNNGIGLITTPVFVAIDADTIIAPEAIGLLVKHFNDEKVGAVAGNVKVGNRRNLITRLQAVEYITAQNLDRRAFEVFNGIMVVPGSIGAWRTEAVLESGGYTLETIVEDADLTVSIIRSGYSVVFEPDAHAFTEAPETIPQWMRQRLRWHFGMLQIAWKHKSAFLERRPVGLFSIPDLVFFGAIASLFAPIADFVMVVNLIDIISQLGNAELARPESSAIVVAIAYIAYLLSDLVLAAIAFGLEPKEDKRLLPWVLTQRFFYRQIYWMVALRSVARALTGKFTGWRKITRTSSISPTATLGLSRAKVRHVFADKAPR
ncbi:glycosyltransferase [Aliiroseovarius sp. KMU-50]|uniref:Chitooligosaccharide deacetylase n=1 Tax=Aliiroseovarius salicola TaxID=3009082 RepID=A0ABT4W732_9RHOB|nr:polysaccharide deacetylase family protein [Aliiroseovarius sp. KMU-50]MDA5095763.1 glycosyltransferase [Aliiroseovarius sp. KMU-50]